MNVTYEPRRHRSAGQPNSEVLGDRRFRESLEADFEALLVKHEVIRESRQGGIYVFTQNLARFYGLGLVFGFSYGGVMPLYAILLREYFGGRIIGSGGIGLGAAAIALTFRPARALPSPGVAG